MHAATVSRTINVPEKVAPETRLRVEAAIRELGFVPNRAARGLITGRTGNVAVIVPDITNPHFASLVRSVERSARQCDLQVLLADTGEHPDEEVRAAESLAREVDGFIVVSPRRLHRALDALGSTPAVFVNRPVPSTGPSSSGPRRPWHDALAHLSGLGHTRLAYLGGPADRGRRGSAALRYGSRGRKIGVEVLELPVPEPTFEADGGRRARHRRQRRLGRARLQRPDGARASSPGCAIWALSVPDDISVVGFDDVPMAAMVAPPLTTISLPTAEVGAVAVPMLGQGPASRELFGQLVIRHSTAPVR